MIERTCGPQHARIAAPRSRLAEPGHVACGTFGEPGGKALRRLRNGIRADDPAEVEAEFFGPRGEPRAPIVVQKSRSA